MNSVNHQYHIIVKNLRRAMERLAFWFVIICKSLTLAPASGVLYSNDGGECGCGNAECGCQDEKKDTE